MNISQQDVGKILWHDLTVPNATAIRDFYQQVIGLSAEAVPVEDHEDYNLIAPATGQPTAGVCHALGMNADLPPVWMIYMVVADLNASMHKVEALGGKILKAVEGLPYCVIQDPAGAIMALYEAPKES